MSESSLKKTTTPLPFSHWLIIAAVTLAYTWFYYQEMLAGPLRLNDDVVQHYLWLFVDHFDLNWKDTFYADASAAIQPRGFYWLLWSLGRVFEPLTISRGGAFFISLLTVGFGVALLRRYTHIFIALAGSLLAVHFGLHSSVGFLARSFMMPLLLAFGYYLLQGNRPWGVAVIAVASALFYPPALLINGGIFGLWKLGELYFWWRGRRWSLSVDECVQGTDEGKEWPASPLRSWYVYLLGFGLALVVVLAHAHRVEVHPTLGGYLPNTELLSQPEFGGDGRVNIQNALQAPPLDLLEYFFVNTLKTPFGSWFAYTVVLLVVLFTDLKKSLLGKFGGWLVAMGIVTVVLYFVARELFPLLFLPDRYIAYPWRLWAAMLFVFPLAAAWSYYPKTWLAAVFAVLLMAFGYYRQSPIELPVSTEEGREELFTAISALPEDALIVLPPHLAEQVPIFTHRNVFLSQESAHALYFRNYHAYIMPRYHDFVEAYTVTNGNLGKVVDFLDKWDIDYTVIDRNQLREGWLMSGFAPFQRAFKDRLKGTELTERSLLKLPDSVGHLIQDRLHLISREELRNFVK
jgi:hypothetical protein